MTSQCDRRSIQIYATNLFFDHLPCTISLLSLPLRKISNHVGLGALVLAMLLYTSIEFGSSREFLSVIQCFIAFLNAFNRQLANMPGMSVEEESEDSQIVRTRFWMKDWMMPRVIGPAGPVPGRKPPLALSQNLTPPPNDFRVKAESP